MMRHEKPAVPFRSSFRALAGLAALALGALPARADDWPMLRHDPARSGFTADTVPGPWSLQWIAEFPNEPVATRLEPIVAGGRVFVGTYRGHLYALDRRTGRTLWRHAGGAPVLHSPAVAEGTLFYGTAGRNGALFALDAATGAVRWRFPCRGGFAASPLPAGGRVYIGGRDGVFYALDARTGAVRFRFRTGGPIRNSAALAGERLLFASDDLHAYALDRHTGRLLWKSARLYGQSFRDYAPVPIGGRVLLRSVLVDEMNEALNGATQFLQRLAGIPGGWRELEAFLHSPKNRGTPERIAEEQAAVLRQLEATPYVRTCFLLDLDTGRESLRAPVLYIAGNQGCGLPPALDRAGRPLLLYRTVYGNWSLGVKPAVGLGRLDPATGRIEPLRHREGDRPPWNTFWGTADESTALSVGGDLLYLCHQGTLAAFDLRTGALSPIGGARDTWGGLPAPIWAVNEWHGPARGACAISEDQLFWITGSRVLAFGRAGAGAPAAPPSIRRPEAPLPPPTAARKEEDPPPRPSTDPSPEALLLEPLRAGTTRAAPSVRSPAGSTEQALREELAREVRTLRDGWPWAPWYLQIGIGSRDFFFADPADTLRALALAAPHLPPDLARWARATARAELPRALSGVDMPLDSGRRREPYPVPPHALSRIAPRVRSPLAGLHAAWLYGERTGDWESIRSLYPRCRAVWEAWREAAGRSSAGGKGGGPEGGAVTANRTLAGALALLHLARRFEPEGPARDALLADAEAEPRRLFREIVARYRETAARAAAALARPTAGGDLHGNPARCLYVETRPHQARQALFLDLTPEIARALRAAAPDAVVTLRRAVELWMPARHLAFEERQVHYGENFVELPDSVHGLFRAEAFLWEASPERLAVAADLPWVAADLFHLEKLALALDACGAQRRPAANSGRRAGRAGSNSGANRAAPSMERFRR